MALADAFKTDGTLVSSTIVADNLNMAIYFLVLLGCVGNAFFRRHFTHPHIDAVEQSGRADEGKTLAAAYWSRKDISLRDIAVNVMYAAVVVTLSKWIGASLSASFRRTTGFSTWRIPFSAANTCGLPLFP